MIMWPFFFGGWRFHKELAHEVRCPPSPFTRKEATRASYWLMCPQPVVAASNSDISSLLDLICLLFKILAQYPSQSSKHDNQIICRTHVNIVAKGFLRYRILVIHVLQTFVSCDIGIRIYIYISI